jgi:hypothetical protein
MPDIDVYRGGTDLTPRDCDIVIDPDTGLVLPERGVSASSSPAGLSRYGGPHRVTNVPPELEVRQVGRRKTHYEIIPRHPMTRDEYAEALRKIVLVPHP